MEQITKTEALVKINSLKLKHEILKKEIIDLTYSLEEKQNELLAIEAEYIKVIEIYTAE